MGKYLEFDGVEGKHGGPYLNELTVLEREKRSAATEDREPQYQQVLDDLYSGNLPTAWESQEVVKDANDNVLNPEATVWDDVKPKHEDIVYDEANSPTKQAERHQAITDALLEKHGAEVLTTPFGNVGNQSQVNEDGTSNDKSQPNIFNQGDDSADAATEAVATDARKVSAGVAGANEKNIFEDGDDDDDDDEKTTPPPAKKATAAKKAASSSTSAKDTSK